MHHSDYQKCPPQNVLTDFATASIILTIWSVLHKTCWLILPLPPWYVWVVLECSFNVRQSNGFQFLCDLDWFSQIWLHLLRRTFSTPAVQAKKQLYVSIVLRMPSMHARTNPVINEHVILRKLFGHIGSQQATWVMVILIFFKITMTHVNEEVAVFAFSLSLCSLSSLCLGASRSLLNLYNCLLLCSLSSLVISRVTARLMTRNK